MLTLLFMSVSVNTNMFLVASVDILIKFWNDSFSSDQPDTVWHQFCRCQM